MKKLESTLKTHMVSNIIGKITAILILAFIALVLYKHKDYE
jgi:hypothetical protein